MFKKILKRILAIVLVVVAVGCVAFGVYASDYYHAGSEAEALVAQADVADSDSAIAVGDPSSEYGLVLYPGGKVAPEAYVPLAQKLAERGVFVVIPKMPFNLAVFKIDAANSVMETYANVSHWWVGGHSLGGAMAASYAAGNASKIEGVALLAAYASDDLTALGLKVEVVYGSNDGVVNRDKLNACIDQVPSDSVLQIAGGNHAGFGDYGAQSGDNDATISADEQQEQTAAAIAAAMKG
jgi:hypothetical protein